MRFIAFFIIALMFWMFPARWGAEFIFADMMVEHASSVPWVMGYGFIMGLLGMLFAALIL